MEARNRNRKRREEREREIEGGICIPAVRESGEGSGSGGELGIEGVGDGALALSPLRLAQCTHGFSFTEETQR